MIPFLPQLIALLSNVNWAALGGFAGLVGGVLQKHWKIALIALLLVFTIGLGKLYLDEKDHLHTEKVAHAVDVKACRDGAAEAQAKADAKAKQFKKDNQRKADAADQNYNVLIARYRASILRLKANQGGSVGAGSVQADPTQGVDGPSTGAPLPATVNITGEDANICAINTARLQAAHQWAMELNKDEKSPSP